MPVPQTNTQRSSSSSSNPQASTSSSAAGKSVENAKGLLHRVKRQDSITKLRRTLFQNELEAAAATSGGNAGKAAAAAAAATKAHAEAVAAKAAKLARAAEKRAVVKARREFEFKRNQQYLQAKQEGSKAGTSGRSSRSSLEDDYRAKAIEDGVTEG